MNQKSLDKMKTEPKKLIKNMNKGGKRGKEDTLHCSPSTANVHLTEPKKLEWSEIKLGKELLDMFNAVFEPRDEFIKLDKSSQDMLLGCLRDDIEETIQSLIQSTKEETIREVMGLECMELEWPTGNTDKCRENNATNQLRNQIKEQINSLLKK